jgi:sugar/nucleoside kinase (ribokinase family)
MSTTIDVVVAGHLCLDIIPALPDAATLFSPGKLAEVGPAVVASGGVVSNTGGALGRLGLSAYLMGKLGDDAFGHLVLAALRDLGPELADGMLPVPGEQTSYSIVLSPPHADRMFLHCPGANGTFGADDIRYELLEAARCFHFGYPPLLARMYARDGAELRDLLCRARATGATVSLDMAMPDPETAAGRADWRRILAAALPYVDVFLPSVEEMLLLLDRSEFDALAATPGGLLAALTPPVVSDLGARLVAMGAPIVALKAGDRGCYLRTGTAEALRAAGRAAPADAAAWACRELWAPTFVVDVAGTTGSGDATNAGFLLGLLRGMTPEATLRAACATGACNVEAADAVSGVRDWEAIAARIAAGWPQHIFDLTPFGWHFDTCERVWIGPGDRQELVTGERSSLAC